MSKKLQKVYFIFLPFIWVVLFVNVYIQYGDALVSSSLDENGPITIVRFEAAILEKNIEKEGGSFFWDTGKGFNPGQVVNFFYQESGAGVFSSYEVVLSEGNTIKALRFDPLQSTGSMAMRNMIIQRYDPREVNFSDHEFDETTMHSIGGIVFNNGELRVSSQGEDPYFTLFDDFRMYQIEAF